MTSAAITTRSGNKRNENVQGLVCSTPQQQLIRTVTIPGAPVKPSRSYKRMAKKVVVVDETVVAPITRTPSTPKRQLIDSVQTPGAPVKPWISLIKEIAGPSTPAKKDDYKIAEPQAPKAKRFLPPKYFKLSPIISLVIVADTPASWDDDEEDDQEYFRRVPEHLRAPRKTRQ